MGIIGFDVLSDSQPKKKYKEERKGVKSSLTGPYPPPTKFDIL